MTRDTANPAPVAAPRTKKIRNAAPAPPVSAPHAPEEPAPEIPPPPFVKRDKKGKKAPKPPVPEKPVGLTTKICFEELEVKQEGLDISAKAIEEIAQKNALGESNFAIKTSAVLPEVSNQPSAVAVGEVFADDQTNVSEPSTELLEQFQDTCGNLEGCSPQETADVEMNYMEDEYIAITTDVISGEKCQPPKIIDEIFKPRSIESEQELSSLKSKIDYEPPKFEKKFKEIETPTYEAPEVPTSLIPNFESTTTPSSSSEMVEPLAEIKNNYADLELPEHQAPDVPTSLFPLYEPATLLVDPSENQNKYLDSDLPKYEFQGIPTPSLPLFEPPMPHPPAVEAKSIFKFYTPSKFNPRAPSSGAFKVKPIEFGPAKAKENLPLTSITAETKFPSNQIDDSSRKELKEDISSSEVLDIVEEKCNDDAPVEAASDLIHDEINLNFKDQSANENIDESENPKAEPKSRSVSKNLLSFDSVDTPDDYEDAICNNENESNNGLAQDFLSELPPDMNSLQTPLRIVVDAGPDEDIFEREGNTAFSVSAISPRDNNGDQGVESIHQNFNNFTKHMLANDYVLIEKPNNDEEEKPSKCTAESSLWLTSGNVKCDTIPEENSAFDVDWGQFSGVKCETKQEESPINDFKDTPWPLDCVTTDDREVAQESESDKIVEALEVAMSDGEDSQNNQYGNLSQPEGDGNDSSDSDQDDEEIEKLDDVEAEEAVVPAQIEDDDPAPDPESKERDVNLEKSWGVLGLRLEVIAYI